MLDYDGTLAPFQDDRLKAHPYPGVEERLRRLAQLANTRIVLVTGRPAGELQSIFPLSRQFELWASHGREYITAAGECRTFPVTIGQHSILDEAQRSLQRSLAGRISSSSIERKPGSLAIHWRGLPPTQQQNLEKSVRDVHASRADDREIELLPFEDGIELRAIGRSKADAVAAVLAGGESGTPIAYLGDDRTDEDAFGALPKDGLAVLVRPFVRPTLADFWITPPEELFAFLDGWISAASGEDRASKGEQA